MSLFFYRLLIGLYLLGGVAAAQAIPVETAYLYDPTGRLKIEDLPAQNLTRFEGDLSLGLREGAGWIRITTQAMPALAGVNDLAPVLRIGSWALDRIDVHEWVEGKWKHQVTGDTQPRPVQSICPDDFHCLLLHATASKPQTVYVRVQNHGLLVVKSQILTQQDLMAAVVQRVSNFTVGLAVAVGFLLTGVAWFAYARSRLMLVYCGFQLTVVLFFIANNGQLFLWFPQLAPATANVIMDALTVARVAMIILLGWKVMTVFQPRQAYVRAVQLLLVLCLVNLLLVMTGREHLALKLNIMVLGINPLIQLWGSTTCRHLRGTRQRLLMLVYVIYGVVFFMGALTSFGDMSSPMQMIRIVHFHGVSFNGTSLSLVFFIHLVYEQITRQREKKMELDNLRVRAEQGKHANEQLIERRTLIEMLTHELKNSLGTVKFALASIQRNALPNQIASQRIQHIADSINRMNGLIEHVTRANKNDFMYQVGKAVRVDAGAFLKSIAAEYANAERFVLHIQPQSWFTADLHLLTVILENLMRNAYLYGLTDKPIHVRVTMSETGSEFEISNPVAPDRMPDAQHLFGRYYRHENVRDQAGLGIGLSLVQSSAEKMKATISYQQRGMNAVFKLKLNP